MKRIITRRRFNIISMFTIVVLLANLLLVNFINKSYANKSPEKYDLRADITIVGNESQNKNKPQGSLKNAELIQLESHIKLGKKNGKYSSFTDEVLSNLNSIESELDYKVKAIFPLYKETTSNGVKYYTNTEGKEATSDELNERRESLKQTIIAYGGVIAYISNTGIKDGLNGSGKVCLCKDIITAAGNQAVVIIGWDDNFSKDNFPENCRPTSNGAFIVQSFDDVFYVSYEDIYIENNLRYIEEVEEQKEEIPEPTTPEEQDEPTKQDDTPEQQEVVTEPEKQEEPSKSDEQAEEPTVPETVPENKEETPVDNEPAETITEPENDENKVEEKEDEENKVTEKEEQEIVVDPSVPTEVTKVETGNDDALEIDTSSIKDTPDESGKSTTQTSSTYTNNTNINNTKTTEVEYVSNANMANKKLPQTGSNAEIYLVIAIAAVMFIAFIVNSLRNVMGSDKE